MTSELAILDRLNQRLLLARGSHTDTWYFGPAIECDSLLTRRSSAQWNGPVPHGGRHD